MWFLNTNKNQLHVAIYIGQINVKFASAIHQKGNITDPLKLLNFLLPKLDGEARTSKLHLFYFKDASSMDEAEKVGGSAKDEARVLNIHLGHINRILKLTAEYPGQLL